MSLTKTLCIFQLVILKTDQYHLFRFIAKNTIKLILAGVIIGGFHRYDLIVALFLLSYLVYTLIRKFEQNDEEKWVYLIGVILTSLLGIICETWGVSNQYWSYHNLGDSREFPYWLPVAWAWAFAFIYSIEKQIIQAKNIQSTSSKMALAIVIAMIFPTMGEIVVINLGAWSYHWPLQFFGVPLLAIFLLIVFHVGISFLMAVILRRFKIDNVVFSPAADQLITKD